MKQPTDAGFGLCDFRNFAREWTASIAKEVRDIEEKLRAEIITELGSVAAPTLIAGR